MEDVERIAALRAKMGPLLRSDDEARFMLRALEANPAVQMFARAHLISKGKQS
jgi:hypothetical protein